MDGSWNFGNFWFLDCQVPDISNLARPDPGQIWDIWELGNPEVWNLMEPLRQRFQNFGPTGTLASKISEFGTYWNPCVKDFQISKSLRKYFPSTVSVAAVGPPREVPTKYISCVCFLGCGNIARNGMTKCQDFPKNPDHADILDRTDFDFDNLDLLDLFDCRFPGSQISGHQWRRWSSSQIPTWTLSQRTQGSNMLQ